MQNCKYWLGQVNTWDSNDMKKLDRISKKIITDNNENRMTLVPPDFSKS